MEEIIHLLILILSFIFGLICINNPFVVARLIAMWFKLVSGSSFERYKDNNTDLKDVFELINQPSEYMRRFSNQITTIQRTGYIAVFVSVIGVCIAFFNGFQ
jgi:hypothetical protein